jgi:hypothetical protein
MNTQQTGSQSAPVNLYTSVAGNIDYRYGLDVPLVSADSPAVTNFNDSSPINGLTPPLTPSGSTLLNWFRADTGISGNLWTPKQGTGYITGTLDASGNIQTGTDPSLKNQLFTPTVTMIDNAINAAATPYDIWFLFKYLTDGIIIFIPTGSGTSTLSISNGTFSIDGNSTGITITAGQWYIIDYSYAAGNATIVAWNLQADSLVSKNRTNAVAANDRANTTFFFWADTANCYTADLIIYSQLLNTTDMQTMLNYFQDRYANYFPLPLTFPTNSTPIHN